MSTLFKYHYCSFDTFEKIMRARSIRFSDLKTMDDPSELNYLWKGYLDHFTKKFGKETLVLLSCFYKDFLGSVAYLSFSLTEDGDSPLMWRLYADEGKGVSVGFKPYGLLSWINRIYGSCVEKDEIIKSETREKIVGSGVHIASYGKIKYVSPDKMDEEIDGYISRCKGIGDNDGLGKMAADAPFRKKDAYSFEDELRVLIELSSPVSSVDKIPSSCEYGTPENHIPIPVKIGSNGRSAFCPTLSIPFDASMVGIVRIGPFCKCDEKHMALMLEDMGYPVERIIIEKAVE